jgi:hypothetical protein
VARLRPRRIPPGRDRDPPAAAARESEKELVAERDRLIARWSAGVDVATLGRELDWLRDEVNRLQWLLLENGIEPEQPLQHPGDPTQQTA